jgi:hypothetical protein|tara:strand:+ start:898 stop:2772 length:1875 start_codon:yes stop_codon:yes gene_type:complete
MAWYDDLLNKTKGFVPDDINIFGAAPPKFSTKAEELGLLGPDAIKNANRQSVFQGLLSTGLAYAAQPKNQDYGSILPYLAKAYGTGMQAAQNPYTQLGKDMQYKQQFDEYEKKKRIEDLSSKIYNYSDATTQPGVYQANADLAPIDAANPLGLNIAPNFNIPKEVTIPGKRTLNEGNLKELIGLDITKGAAALTIDDKFVVRDQLDASKLAIKEFTTEYPQYDYLNQQEPSIAMGTIRSIVGPSRFKTLKNRFVFDTLNNTVKDLGKDNPELLKQDAVRGTISSKGQLLNPKSGKSYTVKMDTRDGSEFVTFRGKNHPLVDFESKENGGKALFGDEVVPLRRNIGDLSTPMLSGDKMRQLSDDVNTTERSSMGLARFLVRNSDAETGFKKGASRIIADMKTIANIAKDKGLTEEQLIQKVQEGTFEALAGKNRLSIVGPGAMTEQDAARLYSALGGMPASMRTNPEAVEMLVSEILRDQYSGYKQNLENYNIQRLQGYASYKEKPLFELNAKQRNSIAPSVLVDLGLAEFTDLTGTQYVRFKKQDRYGFEDKMKKLSVEEAKGILKKMGLGKKKIQIQKELKGEPVVQLDEKGDKIETYREKEAEYERNKKIKESKRLKNILKF